MISRRKWLQGAVVLGSGWGCRMVTAADQPTWRMPDENAPHRRTWMAFGASRKIWGRDLLPEVRANLALIAKTIARFESLTILVREHEYSLAKKLVAAEQSGFPIELLIADIDDLWMRDTGPVFVANQQGRLGAVDFNFNGWGNKQTHIRDAKVAGLVATQAEVALIKTDLVLEGGCIEVDGHGTAIITESCVLNDNRNPGVSKDRFEQKLKPLLGLEKIIWLPGIRGRDITDGHTDFYARFASPGVVLAGYDPDPASYDHEVTKRHLEILRSASDAHGRKLEVVVLQAPTRIRERFDNEDFAAGYIGFYGCNDAIIAQQFGDKKADQAAFSALQKAFPTRQIIQLNVDGIAAGGGSIHCATQQQPQEQSAI